MNKSYLTRSVLTGAFAACLLLAGSNSAFAARNWNSTCRARLEAARARVDYDVTRFGENSRQVRMDVNRLDDTRRWCRDHKADWDHDRFDTGFYIRH